MRCNLNTTKLLDCALIRVCAVIRSNTVDFASYNGSETFWGAETRYMTFMPRGKW